MASSLRPIYITPRCWKLVQLYSLSGRECLFLFGGERRHIKHVERIRNIARNGRLMATWTSADYNYARERITKKGFKLIAEGHSHVDPLSDKHPSSVDVKTIASGNIELICFPLIGTIRAWKIRDSVSATIESELPLIVK